MRFGGHETFPVREGWLSRGLNLLITKPESLLEEHAADRLGVGRNMAKAIRYWLVVAGLGDRALLAANAKGQKLLPTTTAPTDLGRLVFESDPYFLETGTWWALHANIIRHPDLAYTWHWFFNHFVPPRFERSLCVESLLRSIQLTKQRVPSHKTLQRDVACLLASYAQPVPADRSDPEDASECPFRELRLLQNFRASGTYRANFAVKDIPPEIFGYVVARAFPSSGGNDVTLREAAHEEAGPGRAFLLGEEELFELANRFEGLPDPLVRIGGLAGERLLRLEPLSSTDWLRRYYERVGAEAESAA